MYTKQKFGEEAREALRVGAEQVYKAVSSTLGARGRNVVRQNFGRPKITNDGVTIARSINLEDPFERQGADLIKEASEKTNNECGDGTTTSIVLTYSLYENGLNAIKNGANPMVLRKEIETESEKIIAELKAMAIPVDTDEMLESIATISVENPEHGKIVADAVRSAGKDGIVIVEEGIAPTIVKEEVNGYRFDRGLESPYLVTDADKMQCVFTATETLGIPVLITDKSWNLVNDLLPLLTEVKKAGHDKMVIIAEEIAGDLMAFLVKNRMQMVFHTAVVKCPYNKDTLEDIAALTGGTAVLASKGISVPKLEHLGYIQKFISNQTETTLIDGSGDITEKVATLRAQVENPENLEYEKDKFQVRLSALTGKTVVLKVGANTEAETKYLKDKFDDAVNATKAAVEEGIVAGGGMALYRIYEKLYKDIVPESENDVQILLSLFLTSPLKKIIDNAGGTWGYDFAIPTSGYDALNGVVVDNIVSAGIIDPVKVTGTAIKNAVSLACMLLTCETIIASIDDTTK